MHFHEAPHASVIWVTTGHRSGTARPNTLGPGPVGIACNVVFVADRIDTDAFVAPTFGQRLGGRVLEGILLLPVLFLFTLLFSGAVYRAAWFLLVAAYDIGGVAIWGQTIGKRLLETKVVNITAGSLRRGRPSYGSRPTASQISCSLRPVFASAQTVGP
jgi:hypothetical protein